MPDQTTTNGPGRLKVTMASPWSCPRHEWPHNAGDCPQCKPPAEWAAVCQCCSWRSDGHRTNSAAGDAAAAHSSAETCGGHHHRVAIIEVTAGQPEGALERRPGADQSCHRCGQRPSTLNHRAADLLACDECQPDAGQPEGALERRPGADQSCHRCGQRPSTLNHRAADLLACDECQPDAGQPEGALERRPELCKCGAAPGEWHSRYCEHSGQYDRPLN